MAHRRLRRYSVEVLERRWNPAGLVLQADLGEISLPADAGEFPEMTVDVLANDEGVGLRIVSFSPPMVGSVDRLPGAGSDGRDLLRYMPGPGFRGYDSFVCVASDDAGHESTELVRISYSQNPEPFAPWRIVAPAELPTPGDETFPFTSPDGQPLVSIHYDGAPPASVGVLLRWAAPDGDPLAPAVGALSTTAQVDDAGFYPTAFGHVWLSGSIEGVNALLADMTLTTQPGLQIPTGTRLTVQVHLYSSLNIHVGVELFDIQLSNVSTPDPQPIPDIATPDVPRIIDTVAPLLPPIVDTVADELMAVVHDDEGIPMVRIMNPDTGDTVSEFQPADPNVAGASMELVDIDGDGARERVIGLSFRNGAMAAMVTDETGWVEVLADPTATLDQTRLMVLAGNLGVSPDSSLAADADRAGSGPPRRSRSRSTPAS